MLGLGAACQPPAGPAAQPASPSASQPRPPATAQPLTVRWVYDGDTLQLQAAEPGRFVTTTAKMRVRLIGVDAPELRPAPECYAREAMRRLQTLAPAGSTVWVAAEADSWDDYRRRVFHVWNDAGTLLQYDLVSGGYGHAIRVWPNVAYWPLLRAAEREAQAASRGMWGAC